MHKRKEVLYIIITGGVISGIGKGIASASIGRLLNSNLKIVPMKLDGYLNVDPGTMNPIEHGEVFVLDDGGEVDMDFGHYERFLNISCKLEQNLTMGKIFDAVRKKERKGDYLGKTVQFIPHVTDMIKDKIYSVAEKEDADVMLIEVGGTVGDIENELYIEAVRQMKKDVGVENILYTHLTYVPIPTGVNEQKSKPTQQSVSMLRHRGIQPDVIICRSKEKLTAKIKEKISSFCDVDRKAVISGVDVDNVYSIPFCFEEEGLSEIIHKKLRLYSPPDLSEWKQLLSNLKNLDKFITIAICGKYTSLADSYASINEALLHCSAHTRTKIELKFIETTDLENNTISSEEALKDCDGVIIPGGFGDRGIEGKLKIIEYCRNNHLPILGICLGLQLMVVEYARNVCNLENANSTEINPATIDPVIDIMPEQKHISEKGATMRLGACEAILIPNSLTSRLYNSTTASERHRHRFEVNPKYHQVLKDNGLIISGTSKDGRLVEFIELENHPYFVGTQAHPELKSSLTNPAPLFLGLINACLNNEGLLDEGLISFPLNDSTDNNLIDDHFSNPFSGLGLKGKIISETESLGTSGDIIFEQTKIPTEKNSDIISDIFSDQPFKDMSESDSFKKNKDSFGDDFGHFNDEIDSKFSRHCDDFDSQIVSVEKSENSTLGSNIIDVDDSFELEEEQNETQLNNEGLRNESVDDLDNDLENNDSEEKLDLNDGETSVYSSDKELLKNFDHKFMRKLENITKGKFD